MRFLLLLSLSLLAFGCSKENKPCPEDGNCGDGLSCEKYSQTCKKICTNSNDCGKEKTCGKVKEEKRRGSIRIRRDKRKDKPNICLTVDEFKCGKDCKWGNCKFVNGECKATKDEHCSNRCKVSGKCFAVDGSCQAKSEEDCKNSESCKIAGNCSLVGNEEKYCFATKDEDCARSELCEERGSCSLGSEFSGGTLCTALKNEDCAKSKACKFEDKCSAVDGQCVKK